MAGTGFSGKDGTIKIGSTDVSEIRGWKFNPKSTNPQYASNKTAGYKRTVAGVKSANGSASGAYDTAATTFLSVLDVGTSATLKLYVDATHYFSVPAVVDDASINVDVDNGEIVSWDLNFTADGAWTNPTAPLVMDPLMGKVAADGGGGDGSGATGGPPPEPKSEFITDQAKAEIAAMAAKAAVEAILAMGFKPTVPETPATPAAVPEQAVGREAATAAETPAA